MCSSTVSWQDALESLWLSKFDMLLHFFETNWLILSNSWIFLVEIDTGRKIGQPSCRFLVLMWWNAMSHDHSIWSAWGIFNITRYQERCNELLLYIIWWICVLYIYLSVCLSVCLVLSDLIWSDLIWSYLSYLAYLSYLPILSYLIYLINLIYLIYLILSYFTLSHLLYLTIMSYPFLS